MKTITGLFVFFGSIILYFQAVTIYIVYQLKGIIEYNHFWKSIEWLFKTYGSEAVHLSSISCIVDFEWEYQTEKTNE